MAAALLFPEFQSHKVDIVLSMGILKVLGLDGHCRLCVTYRLLVLKVNYFVIEREVPGIDRVVS